MWSMFALAHERSTLTSSSSILSSRTTSQVTLPINKFLVLLRQMRRLPFWRKRPLPPGYEPNVIDNFDDSETTEIFLQEQSNNTQLSYLHDAEISDDTIGKALSSPLVVQEREEPAGWRQAHHSHEQSLLSSESLSVCHVRSARPVHELSSIGSRSSREMENETREELQKNKFYVLKVEELSRRKLTEHFLGVTSFFQCFECQDNLQPWSQRREVPRCWDSRQTHQDFAGSTTVPSGARSKCNPVAGLSLANRKACHDVHCQFSVSTERPVMWMSQKRTSNQELDICQFRINLEREKEQLLAEAKSEILRHEYRADLAEKNICELKRQIWFSSSENWGYSNRVWTVQQSRRDKLHFTKNWQIENEHFVILVLEVFKSWKNWRDIGNFYSNYR